MHEYDESIQVVEDDDDDAVEEDEYEQLVSGRRRAGVSPVKRPPFQTHRRQRPLSRSFVRARLEEGNLSESLEMSADDEGPNPPTGVGGGQPGDEHKGGSGSSGRKMSTKDFAPSPQQSMDSGSGDGGGGGNLMSKASSYAKKLMGSGSDKKKEKPPPDVVTEGAKRGSGEQKGGPPPDTRKGSQQNPQRPPPQKSRSEQEEDDEEDEEDDEYGDMNIEGLLRRRLLQPPPPPTPSPSHDGRSVPSYPPQPPPGSPPSYSQRRPMFTPAVPSSARQAGSLPVAISPHHYHHQQHRQSFNPSDDDDLSDPEVSVMEADDDIDMDFSVMDMYGEGGHVTMDPQMMMAIPPPDINNIAILDGEIMKNMLAHRRMWEYSLDLKRDQLGRRSLVMSDFPGVHAQGHEIYNPQDYDHLKVSPEIKELFQYISHYEPPMIGTQMDVKLKPFIPEYYPSVGDIDAFIKVLHPESHDEGLGIKHLDEPSPFQSDPSVLDLRLRAMAKQSSSKSVTVKKIENVGKNSKIIENWIKDISDLHRSKPSPSVHYSKPMPDIDSLIQEWPPEVEDLLKNLSLPGSSLDCDLPTYVDIICNLLDIPVYKSRIQSLHVLFSLYATYKHFSHYGPLGGITGEGLLRNGGGNEMDDGEIDRLQINN